MNPSSHIPADATRVMRSPRQHLNNLEGLA